jgi:hypothetical protein
MSMYRIDCERDKKVPRSAQQFVSPIDNMGEIKLREVRDEYS